MGRIKRFLYDWLIGTCCSLASNEIDRLANYLLKHFPHEIGRGDPIHGESAVDVAIRLLTMLKEDYESAKEPQY